MATVLEIWQAGSGTLLTYNRRRVNEGPVESQDEHKNKGVRAAFADRRPVDLKMVLLSMRAGLIP